MTHDPATQARIDAIKEQMRQNIIGHGFAVMSVGKNEETGAPPFSYTIGLTERGWPEILISGYISKMTATGLLGNIIAMWDKAEEPVIGEHVGFLKLANKKVFDMRTVLTTNPEVEAKYTTWVKDFYPEERFGVVQLFWPDPKGHLPGNPDYDNDPSLVQEVIPQSE